MDGDHFTLTTGSIARQADVLEATVRRYADRGLLEYVRLYNGVRLFKPSAIERARALKAERWSRCGRNGLAAQREKAVTV